MIKGYDPVITGGKCVTTFMAVEPGPNPNVYSNVIEFEATPAQGGTLCQNGKWRAFDGGATARRLSRVLQGRRVPRLALTDQQLLTY